MVNGVTYRTVITDFFVLALHGIHVNNDWFQQDGTACHNSHATILMPQSIYSVKRLMAVQLGEMVLSIGRQENTI